MRLKQSTLELGIILAVVTVITLIALFAGGCETRRDPRPTCGLCGRTVSGR